MIDIILCIICCALLVIGLKLFDVKGVQSFPAIVINYLTCTVCGFLFREQKHFLNTSNRMAEVCTISWLTLYLHFSHHQPNSQTFWSEYSFSGYEIRFSFPHYFLVVSVDYRHAPEQPFPAAPEVAYAALEWVAQNAERLGGDPARLAVGGTSSGGNLAAVVCLMARDRGGPRIRLQMLSTPVTHHDFSTASYRANGQGYGFDRSSMEWCWSCFLRKWDDGSHPYASPLLAPDLSGLPAAFVMTCEFDPLRDEGRAYAERLRAAGVPVTYRENAGMVDLFRSPPGLR